MSLPIPYCGSPPVPGLATWNLDPVLIAALAALSVTHLWTARGRGNWRLSAAALGWAITAGALISPLCNLSVALFSARVGQHMVLTLVAAPLIVLALPRVPTSTSAQWAATALFAIALWFWHAPQPYEATFVSPIVYWAMHVSLFGAAALFWTTILRSAAPPFSTFFATFVTGMQMSLLGALLTFARIAWFPVHAFTTQAWGLNPLADQQLGGLIMWVPAGLLLTGYAILLFGRELSKMGQPVQERI